MVNKLKDLHEIMRDREISPDDLLLLTSKWREGRESFLSERVVVFRGRGGTISPEGEEYEGPVISDPIKIVRLRDLEEQREKAWFPGKTFEHEEAGTLIPLTLNEEPYDNGAVHHYKLLIKSDKWTDR
ncbi:hypothetical protein COU61_00960 [Candidatus Pacearchaeota archaeon CG10_big_fil_rev_8_21_14_0_10_35_13]|nr:MAG: hypothetical protein COU61_00960 [Candidatus Pacearchaeota archaeon CG10_big_fil_rev_8_21_14_0_10_35_13]